MKLSEMKTHEDVVAAALDDDPAIRAEWERTALARAVAVAVTRARGERGLSQRGLATLLGVTQPQVARLERGDVNPSMETLMRVASGLDIEFAINVRPAARKARLTTAEGAGGACRRRHAQGRARARRAACAETYVPSESCRRRPAVSARSRYAETSRRASSSDPGSRWPYRSSVIEIDAWPRYCETALMFTPAAIHIDAHEWRASWSPIGARPASRHARGGRACRSQSACSARQRWR